MHSKNRYIIFGFMVLLLSCCGVSLPEQASDSIYHNPNNWVYFPQCPEQEIDVFFVAPTVYYGDSLHLNMMLDDSITKRKFLGAINMEKGIYDQQANFYAPYYRQVGFTIFETPGCIENTDNKIVSTAFEKAYADVEDAFEYYLTQSNNPFILAGFSQGSQHLIKLIKSKLDDRVLQQRHIATYAIGWRLSHEEVAEYSQLKNAHTSDDLGVVICYSSEATYVDESLIVPHTSLSINPLSWTTDTTMAGADLNMGACFSNYSGEIVQEIPNLTGAYICPIRGTLKVVDVNADDYPPVISIFKKGEYHVYDYSFFYRNLQENVNVRIAKYQKGF